MTGNTASGQIKRAIDIIRDGRMFVERRMSFLLKADRRAAAVTAVRAFIMLFAGLYAIIWPTAALSTIVMIGGILLTVDSLLSLWSIYFDGERSRDRWFNLSTSALTLALGVSMLLSPLLVTVLTVTFLATLLGFAAIVTGVLQVSIAVRNREEYSPIWSMLAWGICYVLLGLVFLLFPFFTASVGVVVGGLVLVLCAMAMFSWAWRQYQPSKRGVA